MEQLDLFTQPDFEHERKLSFKRYDLWLAEFKLRWYRQNPFYKDEMKNAADRNQMFKKIEDLNKEIKTLEKWQQK